ncbi:MAG: flagellar FlbD family protein [Bryobacteraceae bacterium]
MIRLTRLNHVPLVVNSDLIEHVEITPDTVIALTTGQKFMVSESADEVIERVVAFRRRLLEAAPAHREENGDRQLCPHGTSAGESTISEGGQSSLSPFSR